MPPIFSQYFDDAYGYIMSWANQRPSDAKPLELLIEMTDEDAFSMLTGIEPLWGVSSTTCTAEAICFDPDILASLGRRLG
jgi:hypothetical protein